MTQFKYVDLNGRSAFLNLENFDANEDTPAYGKCGVLYSEDGTPPALSFLYVKSGYHIVEYWTSPRKDVEFDFSRSYTGSIYIYVEIEADDPVPPTPTTDSYVKIYKDGSWHNATPYVYNNLAWHKAKAYVYNNGWKQT